MSLDQKSVGDAATEVGDQTGVSVQSKVSGANPDLERALRDLQKYKARARELESATQTLEQEKLMAEGKKDELINQLQKQLNETKAKTQDMQKTYAYDKVQGWLRTKAVTSGIINDGGAVDKFVSLIDLNGRNPFRDDSTFQLEENVLSQVFEDAKKEMPYFFGKPSPSVKDITPHGGSIEAGGPDFKSMSLSQLKEYAKKVSQV